MGHNYKKNAFVQNNSKILTIFITNGVFSKCVLCVDFSHNVSFCPLFFVKIDDGLDTPLKA